MGKNKHEHTAALGMFLEFSQLETVTDEDISRLFKACGVTRMNNAWTEEACADFHLRITEALPHLLNTIFDDSVWWELYEFSEIIFIKRPNVWSVPYGIEDPHTSFMAKAFRGQVELWRLRIPLIGLTFFDYCTKLEDNPFRRCAHIECRKWFITSRPDRLYCSDACRYRSFYDRKTRKGGRKEHLQVVK